MFDLFGIKKLKQDVAEVTKRLNTISEEFCLEDEACEEEPAGNIEVKVITEGLQESEITSIKERLKVLECEHKNTELVEEHRWGSVFNALFIEKCLDCGKALKTFTKLKFYQEKLKRSEGDLRSKIEEIEQAEIK